MPSSGLGGVSSARRRSSRRLELARREEATSSAKHDVEECSRSPDRASGPLPEGGPAADALRPPPAAACRRRLLLCFETCDSVGFLGHLSQPTPPMPMPLRSAGRRCAHQLHVVRRSSLRRSSLVMDIVQERSMIGSRHAFGRAHTSVPHSSLVTSSGCSLQILQIQMSRDA